MMSMSLQNKVALVTGATSEIGQVVCFELANRGTNIIVADKDLEDCEDIVKKVNSITGNNDSAMAIYFDVFDDERIIKTTDTILEKYGSVDILINDTSVPGPRRTCEEIDRVEWDQTMVANLSGPFLLCKEILPLMKKGDYGRIVNIISSNTSDMSSHRAPFLTSKMGLVGLTQAISTETEQYNINANIIYHGPEEDALKINGLPPQVMESSENDSSLEEDPNQSSQENAAQLAIFLCETSHVTGMNVSVFNSPLYSVD
jgi:NAD(P)-dependent dehydrogenase (short-subunit alcohol dehydrogenase family)